MSIPQLDNTFDQKKFIDAALDKYQEIMLSISANFLQGLVYPRSSKYIQVNCDNIRGHSADGGALQPPYLTGEMANYVINQILPLQTIYSKGAIRESYGSAFDPTKNKQIKEKFDSLVAAMKHAYEKCWPKKHMSSFQIDEKVLKDGTIKAIYSFHMIEDKAIDNMLKAIEALRKELYNKRTLIQSVDDAQNIIKELANHNRLNINSTRFFHDSQQLLNACIWILSAFSDWFDVDTIEPADVLAMAHILVPFTDVSQQKFNSLLKQTPSQEDMDDIYKIIIKQDLYISEPALKTLTSFITAVREDEPLKQKVLALASYITTL